MAVPRIVVAGCGNPLFADDGFGPAVIEALQEVDLPGDVKVIDAGLGGPHFVFTLLDPEVTERLIIVDCADFGAEPGTLARLKVEDLPGALSRRPFVGPRGAAAADQGPGQSRSGCHAYGQSSKWGSLLPEEVIGITDEVRKSHSRSQSPRY